MKQHDWILQKYDIDISDRETVFIPAECRICEEVVELRYELLGAETVEGSVFKKECKRI